MKAKGEVIAELKPQEVGDVDSSSQAPEWHSHLYQET